MKKGDPKYGTQSAPKILGRATHTFGPHLILGHVLALFLMQLLIAIIETSSSSIELNRRLQDIEKNV